MSRMVGGRRDTGTFPVPAMVLYPLGLQAPSVDSRALSPRPFSSSFGLPLRRTPNAVLSRPLKIAATDRLMLCHWTRMQATNGLVQHCLRLCSTALMGRGASMRQISCGGGASSIRFLGFALSWSLLSYTRRKMGSRGMITGYFGPNEDAFRRMRTQTPLPWPA